MHTIAYIHKTTWTSPDGFTKNEIDYVCISTRWRSSLQDVRAFRGADIGSDDNLVVGKILLKLRKSKAVSYTRPYATEGLKNEETSSRFREEVSNRFQALQLRMLNSIFFKI